MTEDRMGKRKRIAEQFSYEFRTKTKRKLSEFFDIRYGFNAIMWDAWLEVPDGQSTAEVTISRFGSEFMEQIKSML